MPRQNHRTGASKATHRADHKADVEEDPDPRIGEGAHTQTWRQRLGSRWAQLGRTGKAVYAVLITAGAAATAVAAISALLPSDTTPPPAKVTFEALHLAPAPVPLPGFHPRQPGTQPATLSRRLDAVPALVAAAVSPSGPVATSGPGKVTKTATPTPTPTPTSGPSHTTGTPSASNGASASGPPGSPASSPGRPTAHLPTSSSTSAAPTNQPHTGGPRSFTKDYVGEVSEQLALAGYDVPSDPAIAIPLSGGPTDPDGKIVPPAEAAQRIVKQLKVTRSVVADSGLEVPLGVVVRATVRIQNAVGVPVQIGWELEGAGARTARLSDGWQQGLPAYLLHARTADDRGVFKIWVPLPKEPGRYTLTLMAYRKGVGLPDDFISTGAFR